MMATPIMYPFLVSWLRVKKQNLENFYPRRKRTGHYEIFSFGSGFALYMEPTQQAAGYSASQNKGETFSEVTDEIKSKVRPGMGQVL